MARTSEIFRTKVTDTSYVFKTDDICEDFPNFLVRFEGYVQDLYKRESEIDSCFYTFATLVTRNNIVLYDGFRCNYLCSSKYLDKVYDFFTFTWSLYRECSHNIDHKKNCCAPCFVVWYRAYQDFIREYRPMSYYLIDTTKMHRNIVLLFAHSTE